MPTKKPSSASIIRSSLTTLRQRGAGLIEVALFIIIAISLIAGGIVYFMQTSEAARVNEAVKSIVSMQSGVRSLYVTSSSFGADGADLAEAVVASGSVSPDMVRADGTIENPWGGVVSVTGHPNTFVVDYRDVPQSACIRLAPHSIAGSGPAGTGIASVAINGVLVDADGDGEVSPTEAEAACSISQNSATPMQMKWAFMADTRMNVAAWEVEGNLGIDPKETKRETESESRACGTGFLGNETRKRDHVTKSDNSVTATAWSDWDRSNCDAIVEVSRRTESENGACPTGMVGQTTRAREVIVMSDGEERIGAWEEWDTSACQIVEVSRRTESENGTCPTGLVGTATRTREVAVMSDGSDQPQAWSSWDNTQCLVVEASRRTDSETAACGAGYAGNQTRTQLVLVMSNGTEQPQGWSAWNRASCAIINVVVETRTYKQESLENCGSGRYLVRRRAETRQRWSNGAVTTGGWYNASLRQIPADPDLWGGEVILTGGGAPDNMYSCYAGGNVPYYREVREYSDCGVFGQQSYQLRRYTLNVAGWMDSAITGSGGCGYY